MSLDDQTLQLLAGFDPASGASDHEIERLSRSTPVPLPEGYQELLRFRNGTEGFVGDGDFLIIWSIDEALRRNEKLNVKELAPQLFLFASNGGDAAYAFSKEAASEGRLPILEVPYIDLGDPGYEPKIRGWDIREFLEYLASKVD